MNPKEKVGGNFLSKVAVLGGQCVRHFFATTLQGPYAQFFIPKVRFFNPLFYRPLLAVCSPSVGLTR